MPFLLLVPSSGNTIPLEALNSNGELLTFVKAKLKSFHVLSYYYNIIIIGMLILFSHRSYFCKNLSTHSYDKTDKITLSFSMLLTMDIN